MMARNLRTSDYPQSARDRLASAVAQARRAAGHRFRPSFAAEAGISKRSLEAVELADASVGVSVLEDIGRALGQHFAGWSSDTPRVVLEGGPIPSTQQVPPEPNVAMLDDLRHAHNLFTSRGASKDQLWEMLSTWQRFWEENEPDRDRRQRTWQVFFNEIGAERDMRVMLGNTATPYE